MARRPAGTPGAHGLRPRLAFSSIRSTIAPARAHSAYRATAMAPNTAGGSGAWPGWKPEPGIDSWRTIVPQPCLSNPGRWWRGSIGGPLPMAVPDNPTMATARAAKEIGPRGGLAREGAGPGGSG